MLHRIGHMSTGSAVSPVRALHRLEDGPPYLPFSMAHFCMESTKLNREACTRYATAKEYVEAVKLVILSPHYHDKHVMIAIRPTYLLIGFASLNALGTRLSSSSDRALAGDPASVANGEPVERSREIC